MTEQTPNRIPPEEIVPEHVCADHSNYTYGFLGWGWYCEICGSFDPIDDMTDE
ncbi:MAG: hypothetical protein RR320_07275 [Oscillospiraceae bacterium]